MEKLVPAIDEFCSFSAIEKADFFKRILFCYVTGNEDVHLKNFSLITVDLPLALPTLRPEK